MYILILYIDIHTLWEYFYLGERDQRLNSLYEIFLFKESFSDLSSSSLVSSGIDVNYWSYLVKDCILLPYFKIRSLLRKALHDNFSSVLALLSSHISFFSSSCSRQEVVLLLTCFYFFFLPASWEPYSMSPPYPFPICHHR